MRSDKIRKFMQLGGQRYAAAMRLGSEDERKLGAQLLLSEVLEYVIKGLGVTPEVDGTPIRKPDEVQYRCENDPDPVEMLDGLADVAYTMYWNSEAFGLPLEEGFELVCDNNLEKFVSLNGWKRGEVALTGEEWDCGRGIRWPQEVVSVQVVKVGSEYFAVGKDARGKVRKPSSYKPVDLSGLVNGAG